MKELTKILISIECGEINSHIAEKKILNLIGISFKSGEKICNCPECGTEIQYGISEKTISTIKNSRFFKNEL